jgi:hypothetical protein
VQCVGGSKCPGVRRRRSSSRSRVGSCKWRKSKHYTESLTRSRVAGSTVGRHVTYGGYLRDGRPSIDLVPTLVWDACLIFFGVLTASVPVLLHMLAELGSVHLLTTNHSRSGRGSGYQLSTLESGASMKRDAGRDNGKADGMSAYVSAGKNAPTVNDVRSDDYGSNVSIATTPYGRRMSWDSQAAILKPLSV